MAKMYPPQPPQTAPATERFVHRALSRLPDSWTVFHSVPWLGHGRRRSAAIEGEADFIILNPRLGVVFLEVKGRVRVVDGQWSYLNGEKTKDPLLQARSTAGIVMPALKDAGAPRLPFVCAAAFPDGMPKFQGGLARTGERCFGKEELQNAAELMRRFVTDLRALGAPSDVTDAAAKSTVEIYRRTLLANGQVSIHLPATAQDITSAQTQLTDEQVDDYVHLMMVKQLTTLGAAGSGKTVLAAARAAQLERQGVPTLFLTPHRALARHVEALMSVNGAAPRAVHVRSLREHASACGLNSEDSQQLLSPSAWNGATDPQQYEAVVVDDAHHINAAVLERLVRAAVRHKPDPTLYVFADLEQTNDLDWRSPVRETVVLRRNCRNTIQIVTVAAEFLNNEKHFRPMATAVHGPAVRFLTSPTMADAATRAQRAVAQLLSQGVSQEKLAVVCDHYEWWNHLPVQMRPGATAKLGSASSEVDCVPLGSAVGLEWEFVVLLLSDKYTNERGSRLKTPDTWRDHPTDADMHILRLADASPGHRGYIGATRARVGLTVIATPDMPQRVKPSWAAAD